MVFHAACIGMCFFGISIITLGSVLPSLTTKLGLDNLQATALVTFLPEVLHRCSALKYVGVDRLVGSTKSVTAMLVWWCLRWTAEAASGCQMVAKTTGRLLHGGRCKEKKQTIAYGILKNHNNIRQHGKTADQI